MGQTCNLAAHIGGHEKGSINFGGSSPPEFVATPHAAQSQQRRHDEPHIPISADAFQLTVSAQDMDSTVFRGGWRSQYALGPMLGDGVSAKVYEAEALTPSAQVTIEGLGAVVWGNCGGKPPCLTERGRRVAIKRFHRVGSRTFKKELSALLRVGVHPNILRLLESYEGCDNEDVLVLEYCDGSTVYDLYAREHANGGLPEKMIARLVKQLLLALEHLNSHGVEHQDVKPENMMLHDVSLSNQQAELKLGDFGWALVVPAPGKGAPYKPPATGAGSLWYAPPELNPPVKGIPHEAEVAHDAQGNPLRGRSDMWSVGVVVYLLLVGHNPFNSALKMQTQDAIDNEVLRLAALGHFNKRSDKWLRLNVDARDFISSLLRVRACTRLCATEALHHPYLTRRLAKNVEPSIFFHGPSNWTDRDAQWDKLDGLQQLGWLAIARAVSEPELDRQAIAAALESTRAADTSKRIGDPRESSYLCHLARELGTSPVAQWLQDRSAWAEVLRLAFAYLDIDSDGLLTAADISRHLVDGSRDIPNGTASPNSVAWATSCRWIGRWQNAGNNDHSDTSRSHENEGYGEGLTLACFRAALLASHQNDQIFEAFEAPLASTTGFYVPEAENASIHPSFSRVTAGPHDHDEEEINWTDLVSRGLVGPST
mmetsp:Transcript_51147/g.79966  ORF Transcript_51147/g.79966 Transcript_51147/m.79966 type:complete len:654 (+) Transcript_51147:84-2045(+)